MFGIGEYVVVTYGGVTYPGRVTEILHQGTNCRVKAEDGPWSGSTAIIPTGHLKKVQDPATFENPKKVFSKKDKLIL